MAILANTANRIKIWADSDVTVGTPEQIDPSGPNANAGGWLTKRLIIKAWPDNGNEIRIWDKSLFAYYPLDAGETLECWVSNTEVFRVNASAGGNGYSVYLELQTGGN